MPVDCGTTRENSVVVIREPLRFHQPLPTAGRPADEIRIARRLAVKRFRERLTHYRHFVDPKIGIVDNGLPILPAAAVERKLPTPALVPRVGRACAESKTDRPKQTKGMPPKKATSARALKTPVPVGQRQSNPDPHAISRRRMGNDGRDAAHVIGS